MSWTPVVISLVALTVVVQGIVLGMVFARSGSVIDHEVMDRRSRDLAATLSTLAFCGYTFVTFFFGRNNLWKFVEALPFQPIHAFARSWLAVPSGRGDLAWMYSWIWTIIAFLVPCIVFVMVNGALTGALWERFRARRDL